MKKPNAAPAQRTIHPFIVRLTHWLNAIAIFVLLMSGWRIYNASPILPFRFPEALTLGGWLGGALLWHFAAMWLLLANFLLMLLYGAASGRYARKLFPIRLRDVLADTIAALKGRLLHDLSRYNAVQKMLYASVLGLIVLVILSGFAIWKPVQFGFVTTLLGGFQGARLVHFLAMTAIAAFIVIHVAMALLVPKTLLAMLRGR